MHPIQKAISKNGGIYSCCSANEYVLKSALLRGKKHNTPVLIEATANQVDQYGGYTGMRPSDFASFVQRLGAETGIDPGLIILGGDHLGPLTFSSEAEAEAMDKAETLVREYVSAGFCKIHIDTSMRVGDDPIDGRLSDETIARRGARLCKACEDAFSQRLKAHPGSEPPVYVIGSEVPIPGGAQEAEELEVTQPEDCENTIAAFKNAFYADGLEAAWERVIAVVVQPGVEFGDAQIDAYNREKAKTLMSVLSSRPEMVFEGHSTDYQTKLALQEMVEDGVGILKVGPALTFALREGLFALEAMEKELLSGSGIWMSDFRETLEREMLQSPKNWQNHYHGDGVQQRFARMFSLSDRARYYLTSDNVKKSVERLMANLEGTALPIPLISQYMPMQLEAVMEGDFSPTAEELLLDRIGNCIDTYLYACGII